MEPKHPERNFNPAYVGSRPDVTALIPPNAKTVLDVGCSNGAVGYAIKDILGLHVTGIEAFPEMAEVAKTRLDRVIVGDAEAPDVLGQLNGSQFDAIIFADILEHLRDPWKALSVISGHLAEGGAIIASIPNVRHLSTIGSLLFKGEWPYRDRGIHDRTHLRFFTIKNIAALFESCGLSIEKVETNYRVIESPHAANEYAKYLAWPGLKHFLAFQYLVRATKRSPIPR